MDATVAIAGILVVVVALVAYLYVPGWLDKRRMHRELQKRERRDHDSGGTE